MNKLKKIISSLGPGLIYAGAAVGVSHLISATKAGALFNYQFIYAIILIHIVKYQFFKFGPLYTSITGKNILHGYKKVGSWSIYLYICMTFISMCIIQATVTIVTSGLLSYLIPIGIETKSWAIALLIFCGVILILGQYKFLEKISKFVIILLSIITIIALILLFDYQVPNKIITTFNFSDKNNVLFLIIFLGWMPAPMEVSVWHSLWAEKRITLTDKSKMIKNTLLDFKVGFIGTAILAIIFIILGAKTIYGTGISIPVKAGAYSHFLIEMYKKALGNSFGIIISIAAFLTMFSTTLTCLDASPRSLDEAQKIITKKNPPRSFYKLLIIINIIGSLIILFFFIENMASMVKIATTLAFIATPIFSLLNYLAMTNKDIPEEHRLNYKQKTFSIICIVILFIFNIIYLIY